ncbi:hypothetical protein Nepgr_016008 [Nepenthes gracilis]|uniref:Uncharacterized protein n=1 Tax=Nepenthes gracilis TaxID=150966 RepID=A0AAD3SN31_NEPGR|nr:hypothetical protein Nepgr_016008 [Nepenthes gracilis]
MSASTGQHCTLNKFTRCLRHDSLKMVRHGQKTKHMVGAGFTPAHSSVPFFVNPIKSCVQIWQSFLAALTEMAPYADVEGMCLSNLWELKCPESRHFPSSRPAIFLKAVQQNVSSNYPQSCLAKYFKNRPAIILKAARQNASKAGQQLSSKLPGKMLQKQASNYPQSCPAKCFKSRPEIISSSCPAVYFKSRPEICALRSACRHSLVSENHHHLRKLSLSPENSARHLGLLESIFLPSGTNMVSGNLSSGWSTLFYFGQLAIPPNRSFVANQYL